MSQLIKTIFHNDSSVLVNIQSCLPNVAEANRPMPFAPISGRPLGEVLLALFVLEFVPKTSH